MGSTSSPSALKCLLGSQTCKTLSSAVLAKCHFAAGLQLISLGLEVCPPWTNINSGGPSSASSGVCSAPIWSRFQIWIRRSSEADAKWVPRWGDHATCVTCAEWDSKEWSLVEIFRISHNATVWRVSACSQAYRGDLRYRLNQWGEAIRYQERKRQRWSRIYGLWVHERV